MGVHPVQQTQVVTTQAQRRGTWGPPGSRRGVLGSVPSAPLLWRGHLMIHLVQPDPPHLGRCLLGEAASRLQQARGSPRTTLQSLGPSRQLAWFSHRGREHSRASRGPRVMVATWPEVCISQRGRGGHLGTSGATPWKGAQPLTITAPRRNANPPQPRMALILYRH